MTDDSLICVVDDTPGVRALLTEAMEEDGHDVASFPDGRAFLAFAEETTPDLVLLDIEMPGPSGWEVRQALREDPELPDAPVVAVTACGGEGVRKAAEETLAFDRYIRKPFDLSTLYTAVEELLVDGDGAHGA